VIKLGDIQDRFSFHPPDTEARQRAHEHVRELWLDMGQALIGLGLVPQGPELEKCVDALDQALMWANAGIARHGPQGAFVTS
jgi:hypothetical protein